MKAAFEEVKFLVSIANWVLNLYQNLASSEIAKRFQPVTRFFRKHSWIIPTGIYIFMLTAAISLYQRFKDISIAIVLVALFFALFGMYYAWSVDRERKLGKTVFQYTGGKIMEFWDKTDGPMKIVELEGSKVIALPWFTLQQDNFFVCSQIENFKNGLIECEVWLERGSLFNVAFRADMQRKEFYMGRLDSRSDYPDCLLHKPTGKFWKELNDTAQLNYHAPASRWYKMRLRVRGKTVKLSRGGIEVDKFSGVDVIAGQTAIFGEVGTVYVRKIVIQID